MRTAGEAYVAALNGFRFTAQNRGNGDRSSRFLSIGSSSCVGVIPDYSMDEVLTMKPNTDGSFKIYGENSGKYISSSPSAVDLASAEDFYLQTSAFGVTEVENVAGFHLTSDATNLLHLNNFQNEGTTENPMIVYGFGDAASRWLLSTDVSRHDLKPAIANATAWKNNLETLINNLVAAKKISVKPTSLGVTLPVAITKAQSAYDSGEGTKVALSALNAALTKAQGTWLGELGTAQQFRFKMSDGTNDYYLTTGFEISYTDDASVESAAGNARLITPLDESNKNQLFPLVPGAETGKSILQSCADGNLQLTNIGGWNTEMSASGSAYKFEEVDLTVPTFKLNTGVACYYGDQQGRLGTAETTLANDTKLFTDKSKDDSYVTWTLEFVAPTLSETLDKTSLRATYDAQNFVEDNSLNIVNQNAPSIKTYESVREEARKVITGNVDAGITLTQIDVNTAEAELKAAYSQMLNNFISEADPTQGYLLQYYHPTNYTAKDLYLTFNTGEFTETHAVNALQLKARSAATQQNAQFVSAGSDNSFYIREGFNKKQVGEGSFYWNPMLKDNGVAYTIELVTLDGIDGLVARLHNPHGYLGCDVKDGHPAVAANDYLYTNNSENNYFILKPTVSPDLVITLYNLIADAERYEGHVGTGVGKYTPAAGLEIVDDATLVYYNDFYMSFINGTEKTNSGIKSVINDVYNALVFPMTINQPTPGKLYRFKGKSSGKYMCAATANAQMSMVESLDNPGVIFQLKAGETIDGQPGYKFLSYNTGYYTKNTHNNGALANAANSIKITASETAVNLGYYTLKANRTGNTEGDGIGTYLYDNGNVVDRNGSYAANNCDWTIEEVTYLPVPINTTVGFGTLYSPVDLKGVCGDYAQDERLEFYYGIKQDVGGKDKLVLTKLEGDIPAETGFIVKYKGGVDEATGCVFMKIADSARALTEDNDLTGTLETVETPTPGTVYTLQYLDNTLGLYRYTGTTVKGGKAYYHRADGAAAPMGFVFDFEGQTTGVESIEVNAENQVIYDLSGRRVAKAGKGLYIINGKKVLVK